MKPSAFMRINRELRKRGIPVSVLDAEIRAAVEAAVEQAYRDGRMDQAGVREGDTQ